MDLLRVVDLKITAAIESKRTILVVHHGNVVQQFPLKSPVRYFLRLLFREGRGLPCPHFPGNRIHVPGRTHH